MEIITSTSLEKDFNLYSKIIGSLRKNGVICYPTETMYGLGADAFSENAVIRIYQIKRRTLNKPTLILVSDKKMILDVIDVSDVKSFETAQKFIDKFWPGPLTILFKVSKKFPKEVADIISAKTGKIGIRISSNPIAAQIVKQFGRPILSTSANISQKKGANSIASIKKNFAREIDLLVDCGDLNTGAPSTIIDIAGDSYKIIREGKITKEQLEEQL